MKLLTSVAESTIASRVVNAIIACHLIEISINHHDKIIATEGAEQEINRLLKEAISNL